MVMTLFNGLIKYICRSNPDYYRVISEPISLSDIEVRKPDEPNVPLECFMFRTAKAKNKSILHC